MGGGRGAVSGKFKLQFQNNNNLSYFFSATGEFLLQESQVTGKKTRVTVTDADE